MHSIEIIMTISAIVAISAGIPQMIKLVRTKKSDEFNLGTWCMWVVTQSVSTAYAFSIHDRLLIAINIVWVTFYLTMSILIIRYSSSRQVLFKSVPPTPEEIAEPAPVATPADT